MTKKRSVRSTSNVSPQSAEVDLLDSEGKTQPVETGTKQSKAAPRKRMPRGLRILVWGVVLGTLLTCASFGLVAFSPASSIDQRPYLIAALFTATPTETLTPSPTLTATASPTISDTATSTITSTITFTPTVTPTETPTNTPTPLPTPDSRDRDFYIPILMYHYISVPPADADIYRNDLSVMPENFRQQMEWLQANGYETISLYDLIYALNIGWPHLPDKPIILTFDDGYQDNYDNAFPILKELGFTGTFFILTDVTDRSEPGYMTWPMLKEMSEAGLSIEVHGREHLEMVNRDESWLTYHLRGPAQTIQANLGYEPRFLAYPSGKYDNLTISVAQEEGYWGAVTTKNGTHQTKAQPYELERLRIRGDWSIDTFAAVVTDS